MKELKIFTLMSFLLVGLNLQAQFDDLYLSSDSEEYLETIDVEEPTYTDYASSDEGYEYYSEYDNYYSSRIRRFSRPAGFNYYNSYYANDLFYDPFRSYYAPQYYRYNRVSRGFIPANTGRLAIAFGNPYAIGFGGPLGYNPYAGLGGFNTVGIGGGGGYNGCVTPTVLTTSRLSPTVSNRSSYSGARRSTASRTSTVGRTSRVQTYGRSSRTAPSTRATNRRSSTRSSARPTRSSNYNRTSTRSGSSFRSSSRSGSSSRSIRSGSSSRRR